MRLSRKRLNQYSPAPPFRLNENVIPSSVIEDALPFSVRIGARDLVLKAWVWRGPRNHKVPPTYSRAEESARSLDGRRDDHHIREELLDSHAAPETMGSRLLSMTAMARDGGDGGDGGDS
jgi:hypothetical protein